MCHTLIYIFLIEIDFYIPLINFHSHLLVALVPRIPYGIPKKVIQSRVRKLMEV